MSEIQKRKDEHLDLAAKGDVGFHETTTLFECVRFVHDAIPDLDFAELDTSVTIMGKSLRAPLIVAGMTGGTDRARRINREIAEVAEARGYGFGLGSQRAMHKNPDVVTSYQVRDVAPNALLLGNIGIVQAGKMSTDELARLLDAVGADGLCVHLNPAQELMQKEGDRDFRGGIETLRRLTSELGLPVMVKETGCGISSSVARRIRRAGICHVDVSGAGGTSWVAVETHRAEPGRKGLGHTFWEWGIPTAASLSLVSGHGFDTVMATGGIHSGLDVAKAIALGANAAGFARPALQAVEADGRRGLDALFDRIETELKMAMLLVGAKDLAALRRAPRVVTGALNDWINQAQG